jgi:hypothetical protein
MDIDRILIFIPVFLSACASSEVRRAKNDLAATAAAALQKDPTPTMGSAPEVGGRHRASKGQIVEIISSGIFSSIPIPGLKVSSPRTIDRETRAVRSLRLIKETDVVPVRVHTAFGFKFRVSSIGLHEQMFVTVKLRHPPLMAPGVAHPVTEQEWEVPVSFFADNMAIWNSDHAWEIVPGKWTFQLFYKDLLLAEKTFTLVEDATPENPG